MVLKKRSYHTNQIAWTVAPRDLLACTTRIVIDRARAVGLVVFLPSNRAKSAHSWAVGESITKLPTHVFKLRRDLENHLAKLEAERK